MPACLTESRILFFSVEKFNMDKIQETLRHLHTNEFKAVQGCSCDMLQNQCGDKLFSRCGDRISETRYNLCENGQRGRENCNKARVYTGLTITKDTVLPHSSCTSHQYIYGTRCDNALPCDLLPAREKLFYVQNPSFCLRRLYTCYEEEQPVSYTEFFCKHGGQSTIFHARSVRLQGAIRNELRLRELKAKDAVRSWHKYPLDEIFKNPCAPEECPLYTKGLSLLPKEYNYPEEDLNETFFEYVIRRVQWTKQVLGTMRSYHLNELYNCMALKFSVLTTLCEGVLSNGDLHSPIRELLRVLLHPVASVRSGYYDIATVYVS